MKRTRYIKTLIIDGQSICPYCGEINNHLKGDVCEHCLKVTIKGIVFYRRV